MKNLLIKNITLISMSEVRERVECNIDIEIRDGKIFKIGRNLNTVDFEIIDGTGKVMLPGFINTHTHIPMVLFRNSIDGKKLEDWLSNFIWPIEDKLTDEEIYTASVYSAMEAIENGITTVHDMYFRYENIIPAIAEVGLDLVVSPCLMNHDGNGEKRIETLHKLMNEYPDTKFNVGIHGLYTSDEEYIKKATEKARELNLPVHMHFCETSTERETIKNNFKVKIPSEVLVKYFKDLKCILAHAVKLEKCDIKTISDLDMSIAHCPVSNLMLGCGIANISDMHTAGINITIGTDGQGSGNNMSMLESLRFTALLQKGSRENPLLMSAYEVLKMATINGAKALSLENEIGSIDEGKRANLVIFNFKNMSNYPVRDYISNIVYNANSNDIELVMVHGNIVMQEKKFKVDREKYTREIERIVEKIFKK